jgi:hypothetical protein
MVVPHDTINMRGTVSMGVRSAIRPGAATPRRQPACQVAMSSTQPNDKTVTPTEHADVVEKTAYTIYGEAYRYLECANCRDQWTADTPGDGCDCR